MHLKSLTAPYKINYVLTLFKCVVIVKLQSVDSYTPTKRGWMAHKIYDAVCVSFMLMDFSSVQYMLLFSNSHRQYDIWHFTVTVWSSQIPVDQVAALARIPFMLRFLHWYSFIYKSILGLLSLYYFSYMTRKQFSYRLLSQDFMTFNVPSVRTELGRMTCTYSTLSTWNSLQQSLKLSNLIPLGDLKLFLELVPVPFLALVFVQFDVWCWCCCPECHPAFAL